MGDEKLIVSSDGQKVFSAVERVNAPPKMNLPQVVVDGHRKFEIADYMPGIWEQRVENLYQSLGVSVSK